MAALFNGVQWSWPASDLFQFPPRNDPLTLPPPPTQFALSSSYPVSIPAAWYNAALDVKVPLTIATIYAATVSIVNQVNRSRGNKPWALSKTKLFFAFVVVHNVFLAVYSAWTFVGMFHALKTTLPGLSAPLVGTVDALCKVHGTTGLGSAVIYDSTSSAWTPQKSTLLLSPAGTPNDADTGRLWNEGLAFYGWFFYLSKFYEVLDTVIILAKGKRSSTLQTYHHAGAMMCMWAGIRFMSPPIWMFVFVNSGIHALMYTYYTLSAFSVYVPKALKQSLTTLQIIQFLVGSSYAAIHSFISYTIPVEVTVETAAKTTITVAVSTAISSAAEIATSSGIGSLAKRYLLRAVGQEEGVASIPGSIPASSPSRSNASFRTEYQTIPCIDTSGQTFAIWLNVLYLAPLTVLFVRFFIKSYSRRYAARKAAATAANKTVAMKPPGNGYANGHTNGKAKH